MNTQTCKTCKEIKEFDQYDRTPAGNPRKECKTCIYVKVKAKRDADPEKYGLEHLGRQRKHKYGITPDEVNSLLFQQESKCNICRDEITYRSAHLDHCHSTSKIRGLLCKRCNAGLGYFRDSPELLKNAIYYLGSCLIIDRR